MKRLILFFIGILLLVIDNSILPVFSFAGAWGSLLFSFAVCYAVIGGPWNALWIGLYSGLLQDIFFGSGLGINVLVNIAICLLVSAIGETIFRDKRLIPVLIILGATVLKFVVIYLLLSFMGIAMYKQGVLIMMFTNTLFGFLFYKRIYKFNEKYVTGGPWNLN